MSQEHEIDLVLATAGGPVDWSEIPASFPVSEARSLEDAFNRMAEDLAPSLGADQIVVRFCQSTGIGARLHPCAPGRYVITLPIGLFVRMYAVGRRLWAYRDRERKGINPKTILQFATSPADDYDPDALIVPDRVRSIFGEYKTDREFWPQLVEFDAGNEHAEKTDFNVSILVNQALVLVYAHELGHLALGHVAFAKEVLAVTSPDPLAEVKRLVRKGLELEADYFAGPQLAGLCYLDIERNGRLDSSDDWAADFFRIGFSLVMLFGAFDPRKRSLGVYDREFYAHPIVRHQAVRHSISAFFSQVGALQELWRKSSVMGWIEAEQCIAWFTLLECMDGASAESLIPIHALVHGGEASSPYISAKLRHGQALFEATQRVRQRFVDGRFSLGDLEEFVPLLESSV